MHQTQHILNVMIIKKKDERVGTSCLHKCFFRNICAARQLKFKRRKLNVNDPKMIFVTSCYHIDSISHKLITENDNSKKKKDEEKKSKLTLEIVFIMQYV